MNQGPFDDALALLDKCAGVVEEGFWALLGLILMFGVPAILIVIPPLAGLYAYMAMGTNTLIGYASGFIAFLSVMCFAMALWFRMRKTILRVVSFLQNLKTDPVP